jgi:hypothetical protein
MLKGGKMLGIFIADAEEYFPSIDLDI